MIAYLLGLSTVIIFAVLLRYLGAIDAATKTIQNTQLAASVVSNASLSDEQKELQLQRTSIAIFKLFFKLLLVTSIALLVPAGLILSLEQIGLADSNEIMHIMLSWHFLLIACLLSALAFLIPAPKDK